MKEFQEKYEKMEKMVEELEKERIKREAWRQKQKEEAYKWIKVGVMGVDSGMCWIGDPCYILSLPHNKNSKYEDFTKPHSNPKELGADWLEFCDKIHSQRKNQPATQFNYDAGHPGLGVCVDTGYGDGLYDIYIIKNEEGRVMEAKVIFITKEEDES